MSRSDEIMNYEQSLNNLNQEETKIVDIDKITPPDYFSLRKIKDLLEEKLPPDTFKELNDAIFQEENILEVETSINNPIFLGQKRKKKEKKITINDSDQSIDKEKQKDISKGKHDKYCGDNIMKKIKLKVMESFLQFENNVINNSLSKTKLINYKKIIRPFNKNSEKFEDLLKIINYKKILRLEKKTNLSELYMSFHQLFINDNISRKYSLLNPDSNKLIIENILKEEHKNKDIALAMNMKFKDWIDIFTYKKDISSILNLDNESSINFEQCIEHVDNLILEIYRKNQNDNYILYLLIYLYNYERWFAVKKGRNRVSRNSEIRNI